MATSGETVEPRARDAAATRAALLQAAMRRFTLLGFERTTTRDIAADAGANVSLIARYFGSKEGLLTAVLEQSADALAQSRQAVDGGLVDSLLDGLDGDKWPEFGGEHPLLLLLRDDSEGAAVQRLRRRAVDSAVGVLAGKIADEAGDPAAAEVVLAVLVGVLTIRAARPHGTLATAGEAELRRTLELLLGSIGATGTASG